MAICYECGGDYDSSIFYFSMHEYGTGWYCCSLPCLVRFATKMVKDQEKDIADELEGHRRMVQKVLGEFAG